MKNIRIADMTLCRTDSSFSFKEKIEIARQLQNLCVDVIEISGIENVKTDTLLVRTIASFVKKSILSVCAGMTVESVNYAADALTTAEHPRLRIELPVSTVGMEYTCHKKAPKMAAYVSELVTVAKQRIADVEFCAVDATRSDTDFVSEVIASAIEAGATSVTVCDSAAEMMPDEFAKFITDIKTKINSDIEIGVECNNKNGMATAASILAVKNGAVNVKTAVGNGITDLETFVGMIKNCGNTCGFSSNIKYTELNRIIKQIRWIANNAKNEKSAVTVSTIDESGMKLDINDSKDTVISAVSQLGYDLSEDDSGKVYEEFQRVAAKKQVGAKELDAIVASVALQVPPTYKLVSYVINNGNIIPGTAQITVNKQGKDMQGICIGDGPIDAAFLAIEQIIGHHYELDDFQIQSVTEGKEAMGSALVKLRSDGKLYSGNGISTDIIGASINAYINAVNKIVYEEA